MSYAHVNCDDSTHTRSCARCIIVLIVYMYIYTPADFRTYVARRIINFYARAPLPAAAASVVFPPAAEDPLHASRRRFYDLPYPYPAHSPLSTRFFT